MKIAVIADDFTGANDTGVQFATCGLSTVVTTLIEDASPELFGHDVVVIDTESRFHTPSNAYKTIERVSSRIKSQSCSCVYKKIDSLFRGNVGAELAGYMSGFNTHLCMLIPALPIHGRTTVLGHVLVHGEKLNTTEVAHDPRNPVTESYIPHLISSQTDIPVIVVSDYSLNYVNALLSQVGDTPCIMVFDAVSQEDLLQIAHTLKQVKPSFLLAGTAGFAEYISILIPEIIKPKPVLAVIGSMSVASMQQITYATNQDSFYVAEISEDHLVSQKAMDTLVSSISEAITKGKNTILCTSRSIVISSKIVLRSGVVISKDQTELLSEEIALCLGEITQLVLESVGDNLSGVFLTGGDTLMKVASAVGAQGMIIDKELLPGVPLGRFLHDTLGGIPISTKAGSFGGEQVLHNVITILQGCERS